MLVSQRPPALEPPLQLAEFGEYVKKATSHALLSVIRHVFFHAYVFPTWATFEIARKQDVIGLGRHGAVLISVIDSNSFCSAVDFIARAMGS